jgi:hypothetical protein
MSETTPTPQSETKPVTHHVSPLSSQSPAPASTPAPVNPPAAPEPKKVGAFVIEDGIEIPPTGPPKKSSEFADVLKALKVGQSFTVAKDKRAAVTSAAKNLKVRIATRKAGEEKIRVWRVAEDQKSDV